jgi:hypothetical protein
VIDERVTLRAARMVLRWLPMVVALCAGCAMTPSPPVAVYTARMLASMNEPAYATLSYAELPRAITMSVRMTSTDISARLQREIGFQPGTPIELRFLDEQLIESHGVHYRRQHVQYVAPESPARYWTQELYLWFTHDGMLGNVYREMPLHWENPQGSHRG